MELIKIERKGKQLNTLERYHIRRISKEGCHINDIYNEARNPIFEALQERTPDSSTYTLLKNTEESSMTKLPDIQRNRRNYIA
jgi:hypothetical protein